MGVPFVQRSVCGCLRLPCGLVGIPRLGCIFPFPAPRLRPTHPPLRYRPTPTHTVPGSHPSLGSPLVWFYYRAHTYVPLPHSLPHTCLHYPTHVTLPLVSSAIPTHTHTHTHHTHARVLRWWFTLVAVRRLHLRFFSTVPHRAFVWVLACRVLV